MKYNNELCFYCGKYIGAGNNAVISLSTDTYNTQRNFCSNKCIHEFKQKAKKSKSGFYTLPVYYGKKELKKEWLKIGKKPTIAK